MLSLQKKLALFYLFFLLIPRGYSCPIFIEDSLLQPQLPQNLDGWLFYGRDASGVIHYFDYDIMYIGGDGILTSQRPGLHQDGKRRIILGGNDNLKKNEFKKLTRTHLLCAAQSLEWTVGGPPERDQNFIYAQNCGEPRRTPHGPLFWQQKVVYDKQKHTITSPHYLYAIDSANYMLFTEIDYFLGGSKVPLAFNSSLFIFADVKNFFSLLFDKSDIGSHMYATHILNTGLHASIDFYLSVLFFKVNLNLLVDAFFFPNTVFIPMKVSLPISAKKYLRDTSGIFYTWLSPKNFEIKAQKMIEYGSLLAKDKDAITADFCPANGDGICVFTLIFKEKDRILKMNFELAEALIGKGFYPQLVLDPLKFQQKQNWPNKTVPKVDGPNADKKGVGLFFSTAQLDAGDYQWDFWIEIMSEKDSGQGLRACPEKAHYVAK